MGNLCSGAKDENSVDPHRSQTLRRRRRGNAGTNGHRRRRRTTSTSSGRRNQRDTVKSKSSSEGPPLYEFAVDGVDGVTREVEHCPQEDTANNGKPSFHDLRPHDDASQVSGSSDFPLVPRENTLSQPWEHVEAEQSSHIKRISFDHIKSKSRLAAIARAKNVGCLAAQEANTSVSTQRNVDEGSSGRLSISMTPSTSIQSTTERPTTICGSEVAASE